MFSYVDCSSHIKDENIYFGLGENVISLQQQSRIDQIKFYDLFTLNLKFVLSFQQSLYLICRTNRECFNLMKRLPLPLKRVAKLYMFLTLIIIEQ